MSLARPADLARRWRLQRCKNFDIRNCVGIAYICLRTYHSIFGVNCAESRVALDFAHGRTFVDHLSGNTTMSDDAEFVMTYPCYFLYGDSGGLVCNTVDGNDCLCLFTSPVILQKFQQFRQRQLHGASHVDRQAPVATCNNYDELIGLLKSGEGELAKIKVFHIAIDPQQGQPILFAPIRDFIEQLPRA